MAMRTLALLALGLLASACGTAAFAQTASQPTPAASGTVTGTRGQHFDGIWQRLESLDGITAQQRQQIEALRAQYQQTHQPGTMPDRATMQSYRQKLMQILTQAQQEQLRAEIQQFRQQRQQQLPQASPQPR